jgi:hypothetical protein
MTDTDAAHPEEKSPGRPWGFWSAPEPAADEDDREARQRKDGLDFRRIVLILGDGTRIVVEDDGEVWKQTGRSRTLTASLDAAELADLRRRIGALWASSWQAASPGDAAASRILVETDRGTTALALPASDPLVNELAALLESWGA